MTNLAAAAAVFLLIHFGVSGTRLRGVLVSRLGERPYRGLFALASIASLVWMGIAYARAPFVILWGEIAGSRPVAMALVLVAFQLVIVGVTAPNPVMAGMEPKLALGPPTASGITRITRHPFLWGLALWALAHLAANGDLASVILFGSLLLLSLGGTRSIDAKWRRRFGERWDALAMSTSNLPFAAIASGRNQLGPALREIGIARPSIALIAYGGVLAFHGRLFGVDLL